MHSNTYSTRPLVGKSSARAPGGADRAAGGINSVVGSVIDSMSDSGKRDSLIPVSSQEGCSA
jgi:hypothetical protein